jgi:hypothetical protein
MPRPRGCDIRYAGKRLFNSVFKSFSSAVTTLARLWIEEAREIYILGYGFDPNNNRRIGLHPTLQRASTKVVFFTNRGDINTVNKKASTLFFGTNDHFLGEWVDGNPQGRYFEKSIRNVYDAIESDFDALEGIDIITENANRNPT